MGMMLSRRYGKNGLENTNVIQPMSTFPLCETVAGNPRGKLNPIATTI
jgi:hypothetical protein